ncbi:MAG: hydantoinase/oxoprolinase family protein [Pseudomonadota bacterium]
MEPIRIGIDVGGTHTDAVAMRGMDVLGAIKTSTTQPISAGILNAVDQVLIEAALEPASIAAVILGTTQFTNAVIERRQLSKVAAIRAGLPSGRDLPPFTDWPDDLVAAVKGAAIPLPGGVTFDGAPLSKLQDADIDAACTQATHYAAAAVSTVFGPLDSADEQRITAALQSVMPPDRIVGSTSIGSMGLLERENAAILNASLLAFAQEVTAAISSSLQDKAFTCPLFLTQNDGTLMDLETAARFPARTFASGPTNSLRGAALLSGVQDAIVIDIGGTTSDVGVLKDGFARQSRMGVDVGGVRTNFRMPDILAIGLGGGSIVSNDGSSLGPHSVGHKLPLEGRVFGGPTLTATDIAVQDGTLNIGAGPSTDICAPAVVETASNKLHSMLDDAIARMCGRDKKPVLLVGGGAILVTRHLSQAAEVIRPPHAGVANAVGASIAQAAGEVDQIVPYRDTDRTEAINTAKAQAADQAVRNGAKEDSVTVLDIEETPFSYMENKATRLRVKAVGDLDFARLAS